MVVGKQKEKQSLSNLQRKETPCIKHDSNYCHSSLSEVLARATSIKDELEVLRNGTFLYKVRNKGMGRGVKAFRRRYRLDVADLRITYHPNKHMKSTAACAGGSCKSLTRTNSKA